MKPRPVKPVEMSVRGMHCASCVASVERALVSVDGVAEASVNLVDGSALVRPTTGEATGDGDRGPSRPDPKSLVQAVEDAGYQARVFAGIEDAIEDARAREAEQDADRKLLAKKVRWGACLGAPIVLVGHWHLIPGAPPIDAEVARRLAQAFVLLTLPFFFFVGSQFFVGAWAALKRRAATMDMLIALGTGSAWLYSTAAVVAPRLFPDGAGGSFFGAVAVVMTLTYWSKLSPASQRPPTHTKHYPHRCDHTFTPFFS